MTPRTALERIRGEIAPNPYVTRLVEFLAGARRGICGPPGVVAVENEEVF